MIITLIHLGPVLSPLSIARIGLLPKVSAPASKCRLRSWSPLVFPEEMSKCCIDSCCVRDAFCDARLAGSVAPKPEFLQKRRLSATDHVRSRFEDDRQNRKCQSRELCYVDSKSASCRKQHLNRARSDATSEVNLADARFDSSLLSAEQWP